MLNQVVGDWIIWLLKNHLKVTNSSCCFLFPIFCSFTPFPMFNLSVLCFGIRVPFNFTINSNGVHFYDLPLGYFVQAEWYKHINENAGKMKKPKFNVTNIPSFLLPYTLNNKHTQLATQVRPGIYLIFTFYFFFFFSFSFCSLLVCLPVSVRLGLYYQK